MRNQPENQITFVFIRHGETKANRRHCYLGRTDEPLCEAGKEKLLTYKKENRYPKVDYVFTSPMERCVQTAELLYPNVKKRQIFEWMEMDFGAFEGKNYSELNGDERYQRWIDSNGTLPFPEGESREEFIKRCIGGFEKMKNALFLLQKEQKQPFKKVGVVVHGGTIMALLSSFFGGAYFDYQVQNGGGYQCSCILDEQQFEIIKIDKI